MFDALPSFVRKMVETLSLEPTMLSVWLIGSQANASANPGSDWDLMVFASTDPVPGKVRQHGIDIIQVGPSGFYLLEGVTVEHLLPFADWEWQVIGGSEASYSSWDDPDKNSSVIVAYDHPRIRKRLRAVKLWARPA